MPLFCYAAAANLATLVLAVQVAALQKRISEGEDASKVMQAAAARAERHLDAYDAVSPFLLWQRKECEGMEAQGRGSRGYSLLSAVGANSFVLPPPQETATALADHM